MTTPDITEQLLKPRQCGEGDCENGALLRSAATEIGFLRRELERQRLRFEIEHKRRLKAEATLEELK